MNMYRKAAVFLHGLTAADRDWMLARLENSQRAVLDDLLAELRSLGIPQAPSVLSDAGRLSFDEYDRPPPPGADAPSHIAALATAAPRELWSILDAQPDTVVSAVLSAEAWPWREQLLELMPASRRESVERRRAALDPLTPKARDALLRSVARCLPAADGLLSERRAGAVAPRARRPWWGAGRRRLSWQS